MIIWGSFPLRHLRGTLSKAMHKSKMSCVSFTRSNLSDPKRPGVCHQWWIYLKSIQITNHSTSIISNDIPMISNVYLSYPILVQEFVRENPSWSETHRGTSTAKRSARATEARANEAKKRSCDRKPSEFQVNCRFPKHPTHEPFWTGRTFLKVMETNRTSGTRIFSWQISLTVRRWNDEVGFWPPSGQWSPWH